MEEDIVCPTSEGYTIKYDSNFVNKYPRRNTLGEHTTGEPNNPNHLLEAFPCLFPYGMRGFKVKHPHPITYKNHAKWAMRYVDKRFRKDLHFMFQVFVCRAAILQVQKKTFHDHEEAFHTLTSHDLTVAGIEELNHKPLSNPIVHSLKQHVNAVWTKVIRTDESHMKIRALIWGMTLMKNPPSLWIMLNLIDMHNPIAQVFIGEEINLDAFNHDMDPFGAAHFYYYIIQAILANLFSITISSKGKITWRGGIFGIVEGYNGTVCSRCKFGCAMCTNTRGHT
ncbi:uncharacterized protein EDB93DRAFT_1237748 [Suillus bovinus]|uniref:uncharacterized protein n=1 Tax=Suillus bovinus TaxID=48563 RepID=UPI001B874880|nr:uncharacterized protein EDB93DRAFT_1237748 [Suillus bovinus]KAG2158960.1 hypothetical protein EDB93DRAFT_1237748 [Suillus bovinus]